MKKRLTILLLILLTGCLCSCSLSDILPVYQTPKRTDETVVPYREVKPDNLTYSEGYEPVTSSYSYDALPKEGEKLLYTKILENCYDISPNPTEDRYPMPKIELNGYSLSEAEVRTTSKALTDDHPEIFWMTGTMGFYSDEDMTVIQPILTFHPRRSAHA